MFIKKESVCVIILCLGLLLLTGCGTSALPEGDAAVQQHNNAPAQEKVEPLQDEADSTPAAGDGIYYEAGDADKVSREYYDTSTSVDKEYNILHFDGRVYTSLNQFVDEEEQKQPEENYLGEAYMNAVSDWSATKEEIVQCEEEGKIYSVDGYPQESVVCISYIDHVPPAKRNFLCRAYFICLNGMSVKQGSELFQERLHFENMEKVSLRVRKEKKSYPLSQQDVNAFLDELNSKEFEPTRRNSFGSTAKRAINFRKADFLIFEDKIGLKFELYLAPSGKVMYLSPEGTEFVVSIGEDVYKKLMEAAGFGE